MKTIVMFLILLTSLISMAWAGDDPPTPMSNKEAIALVQTNADYVWTIALLLRS